MPFPHFCLANGKASARAKPVQSLLQSGECFSPSDSPGCSLFVIVIRDISIVKNVSEWICIAAGKMQYTMVYK